MVPIEYKEQQFLPSKQLSEKIQPWKSFIWLSVAFFSPLIDKLLKIHTPRISMKLWWKQLPVLYLTVPWKALCLRFPDAFHFHLFALWLINHTKDMCDWENWERFLCRLGQEYHPHFSEYPGTLLDAAIFIDFIIDTFKSRKILRVLF